MKKIFAILLIAFLLFAVGCKKVDEEPEEKPTEDSFDEIEEPVIEEPEKVEQKPVEKPTEKPKEEKKPTVETKTDTMDPKIRDLLKKHESIKSYSFFLTTTENWELWRDQYFVKGDLMKIKLYEVNLWDRKNYFDSVYLNRADKTGVAFCENRGHKRCEDRDREFTVDYESFAVKTPLEWLSEVGPDAKVVGSEQFDERLSQVIEYTQDDGRNVRMWVDRYAGIPVRVEVYVGEYEAENIMERYGYRDLSINSVSTADITHQGV